MQRTRVGFSIKEGGLGLRTIADKTDAAYIASRHATHFLCTQIRHCHRGDQNPRDDHLQRAMDALDVVGPGLDVTQMVPDDITQTLLNERIEQQNMADWRNGASPLERVHLQAYSAKRSGHEVSLVPSKTLDIYLTPSEFVNTVATPGSRRHGQWHAVLFLWPPLGRTGVSLPLMYGGERRFHAAQWGPRRLLRFL